MRSGQIGGVKWKTLPDGTLVLEGEGHVSIDTELPADEGMMRVGREREKLSMCPGCKQWLSVAEDGSLPHDDEQTVRCVLDS